MSGYSKAFNFCLSAELTATAARAPAPPETKFDNNISGCGFEFGTVVSIITDIIKCFEKKEREHDGTVSANIINNFCEREEEEECGFISIKYVRVELT